MSSKRFGIDIALNTNDVAKGAKDAEKALDKLEDTVGDVGKGGAKDAERLEDALRDVQKQSGRTEDAIDDIRGSGARAFDGVKKNAEEFKDEAIQNFSEVTSSFDGSMDSLLDLAQGTLGGLASGIAGPLGLAFGVAAAGIGALTAGLIESEEKTRELKERAREFAIEAMNTGESTEQWLTNTEQVVARIQELEQMTGLEWRWFWDEDPTHLKRWVDALHDMGRSGSEVSQVLKMSTDDMKDHRDAIKRSRDAIQDQVLALARSKDASKEKLDALHEEFAGHETLLTLLEEEITVRDEAAASAERQGQAGVDANLADAAAAEERSERVQSAQQAVESSVTSAYDNMRSAANDYATNEEGALDINRWLEYMNEHAAAVATYQENLQAMQLTPEQWQNLMEMPEQSRMQWVSQFAALPEDARAPFSKALNDVGASAGDDATVAFEDAFTPEANVVIETDTVQAEREVTAFTSKRRTAKIRFEADMTAADRTVANWRRNQATRPIYVQGRFLE